MPWKHRLYKNAMKVNLLEAQDLPVHFGLVSFVSTDFQTLWSFIHCDQNLNNTGQKISEMNKENKNRL